MSLAALINPNGGEPILVSALRLTLTGARKLPEIAEGVPHGIKEFGKVTRQVIDEILALMDVEPAKVRVGHLVLMALTFVLGAACLILMVYEFAK